ncbi:hypothetical protein C1645_841786 [Glomus cerebriforme]|uniref:Uncharacterized protein n=1 Tax=Glomus cerebriforme TaxID=658196 RepID=A0A397S8F2_9GLOM|nr:hypothetical protein C1645_841786 [Glomus cerebriforme]
MDGKKIIVPQKVQIEEVKYIENEVLSWEEFEKNYKVDEKVDYSDLNNGDIGTQEGYGPCNDAREEASKIITEEGH